jgi:hypothetical protein
MHKAILNHPARFLVAAAAALACLPCFAEQNAIRLAGQAQPGAYTVEDIVGAITKGIDSDREKALALHRYGMAHFIHFDGPIEERGEYITDPMKLINVYGYALCGNNSAAMNALYNAAGLKARRRSMPGHSVPEVWFEGKWNYIDTDMFGYVFLPDGKIASVDELSRDADLFLRQDAPSNPFYPFDKKEDMASVFRNVNADRDYHTYSNAHIMNLSLRTGESARLYFQPQGEGRYFLTPAFRPDLGFQYKDYWPNGPVRKDSFAWTEGGAAHYGNGLLSYSPDLRSEAFARENPNRVGIAVGQGSRSPQLIAAAGGQPASVIIKVSTPWIIAGLQNDLTTFDDNTEGAVVSGLFWRKDAADENRISISRDLGQTWTAVWENKFLGAVPFRVDLTKWAEGEYGYWVKFEWLDRKGSKQAGVERLKINTWVELSPMALPRLVEGRNMFRLDTAPERAFYNHSRWDRAQPLPGQKLINASIQNRSPYFHAVDTTRPATLIFPTGAEGEIRELRLSLRARAAKGSQGVTAVLSISEDAGGTWRELERFTPNPDHTMSAMWFNHVVRGKAIDASRCLVKVDVTGGGLDQVIANSLLTAPTAVNPAMRVTYVWREGDLERRHSQTVRPGSSYDVTVGAKLINREVLIEGAAQ